MAEKMYSSFMTVKKIICILFLTVYMIGVILSGGSVLELALFGFSIVLFIMAPGIMIYKKAGFDCIFGKMKYSVAISIGMAVFLLSFILQKLFQVPYLPFIVLRVISGFCLNNVDTRKIQLKIEMEKAQQMYLLCIYAFIIFIFTFLCVAKHAHPGLVGEITLSQDFMWTVGNAESINNSFPPQDIRFAGVILKYHYLTELITAAISSVTGVSCYNILAFYMQSFIMLFFVVALYDLGDYYYNSIFKANVFTASFFVLSCFSLWKALPNGRSLFSNNLLETLISNVNSQATSFAFLCVFCLLVVRLMRGEKGNIIYYIVTFMVMIELVFSKSPVAAIVVIALVCACAVNLISKNRNITVSLRGISAGIIFAVIYFTYFSSGANKSTSFSLTKTLGLGYFKNYIELFRLTNPLIYKISIPSFIRIQTVCMAPFQSITVLPRAICDIPKILKLPFEKLWAYAAVAGGILAFFVSYHEAFSQVYFIYVAIFFMNLLSIEYFSFGKIKITTLPAYGFAILSMISSLFFYTNFGGSGIRQFLFNYDVLEKYPYQFIVKAEDEHAGQFLKQMSSDELFITNRTHTGAGEGLSNVYTCFSGKQSYMEGFKYTVSNMGVSWYDIVEPRVKLVGSVFGTYNQECATHDEIVSMCKPLGIRYAVLSSQFEGGNPAFAEFEEVFSEGTVTVYKLY